MRIYIIWYANKFIVNIYSSLEEAERHLGLNGLIKHPENIEDYELFLKDDMPYRYGYWTDPNGYEDEVWHIESWDVSYRYE